MSILSLKLLRDAGLAPDWMTVYVGWLGFDSDFGMSRLPAQDVQDFAYERIGNGSDEENYAALRIIDLDIRQESLAFELGYLKGLAGKFGVAPEIAKRKWRLADFSAQISYIAALPERLKRDGYATLDTWEVLTELELFWNDHVSEPPLPTALFEFASFGKNLPETMRRMTLWADRERAAISALAQIETEAEIQRGFRAGKG